LTSDKDFPQNYLHDAKFDFIELHDLTQTHAVTDMTSLIVKNAPIESINRNENIQQITMQSKLLTKLTN